MQDDNATNPFVQPVTRARLSGGIAALILVHILLDVVLGYFSADTPAISSAIFFSLIFAQTSLLGMWGGLAGIHWLIRVIGTGLGAIYLWIACGLGIDELNSEILLSLAVATGLVMVACWGIRAGIGPIQRRDNRGLGLARSQEGLQFGIRHLMILMLVVACLVSVIKALAPEIRGLREMTVLTMVAFCFVANALALIWAMLGLGPVLIRALIAIIMSGLMGWLVEFLIAGRETGFWISVVILQTVYMVISLGVVRILGYRLLRKDSRFKCV